MKAKHIIPQALDTVAEVDFRQLVNNCIYGLVSFPGSDEMIMESSVNTSKNFYSNPQLIAVMLNTLLINCFKYKKDGIVSRVKIGVEYDNYKAILSIADNGKGINEKGIGKIFELFNKNNNAGAGTGLYMVNEIVKKLGGKISVESAENIGTEFIIEIPNQIHIQNVLPHPASLQKELKYFH
ncbi:MAG: ATP-binding protein [Bacteroidetes bacterium]|nr:ATP-binding protein [Bacteroidota bacterium]HNR18614.1 ATP-binding protein [Bacteroidia bacterium]HNU32157.1 ATP-binding protein [Bacteroidia bacterium]